MFGAKYSRLKFWIISIVLLIPTIIASVITQGLETGGNNNITPFDIIAFILVIMWINTLANRIRDYGSNPWNAFWAFVPLANLGLALYYGIVKEKANVKDINSKNDTSLTKAVVNHTKDIACDIKPKIHKYIEKHSDLECEDENIVTDDYNCINTLSENEIYEKTMFEIEEDKKIKATWAKAFSQSNGDENKAKALYINLRVEELKIDNKQKLEDVLIQKKERERLLEIKKREDMEKGVKIKFKKQEIFEEEKKANLEYLKRKEDEKSIF